MVITISRPYPVLRHDIALRRRVEKRYQRNSTVDNDLDEAAVSGGRLAGAGGREDDRIAGAGEDNASGAAGRYERERPQWDCCLVYILTGRGIGGRPNMYRAGERGHVSIPSACVSACPSASLGLAIHRLCQHRRSPSYVFRHHD